MLNKTLSLQWNLTGIRGNYIFLNASLYVNVTAPAVRALVSVTRLFSISSFLTRTGINLFGNRVFVWYRSNTYNFMLNKLQYSDVGSYFLQVAAVSLCSGDITVQSSTIVISKIKGKCCSFLPFVFP